MNTVIQDVLVSCTTCKLVTTWFEALSRVYRKGHCPVCDGVLVPYEEVDAKKDAQV